MSSASRPTSGVSISSRPGEVALSTAHAWTDSALPLSVSACAVAPGELALGEPPGLRAREHDAGLGRRLQARRDVDGVAGGAVLDAATGADRADDDRAGVDADPHREARDGEAALDVAGELAHVLGDPQRRS